VKIPPKLEEALHKTGLPWEVEYGAKHYKVSMGGKLVAVFPHGKGKWDSDKRAILNTVTQVRRAARQIKEA
jgi:hypothetical protein